MDREAWARVRRLAARQDWLVTTAQACALGLTDGELAAAARRGACRTLLTGVHLLDPDVLEKAPPRVLYRAALLAHGPGACLVGVPAARVWGLQGLPAADARIEVALVGGPSRHVRRARDGAPWWRDEALPPVVVRQLPVTAGEIEVVDGLAVRSVAPTVVDAALGLDRMAALAVLDSALHLRLVDRAGLDGAVAAAKGRPGVRVVRELAARADGRAESPLESRVRLICIDGWLAPDELQYEVRSAAGQLVAIGDLAWLRRRRPLLGEADGAEPHSRPRAVLHDRRRGNTLVRLQFDVVRFTWEDTLRPDYIRWVVRSALAA